MAALPILLDGAVYDKTARTMRPVRIVGMASITGLIVGGGPIGEPPLGTVPPPQTEGNWEWGYSPGDGWHLVYVPGDKPVPVPPPSRRA